MSKKIVALVVSGLATLAISQVSLANEELAKTKGCFACHKVNEKFVGPAYKDVAAKYKSDKTAPAKLAEKVIKGGKGAWGEVPMPPNAVTPDEAKKLVAWVLSQK